jgi:hypothetical protein
MKSMLAGLGAAALISSGLVAVSTTTADAAPYPGTVRTNCHVDVRSATTSGGTRVAVWVTAPGDGQPRGQATVRVDQRRGRDGARDSGRYTGGKLLMRLGKLRPGVYDGNFHFDSAPAGSVYKNCNQGFTFRVTRR